MSDKHVQQFITTVKEFTYAVMQELDTGWPELVYQIALEVALRDRGLMYETQRNLPITFAGHVVGHSKPDLVIWLKDGREKVALVVDLKADAGLKEDHSVQVARYIKELRKQVKSSETVHPTGLVINFVKEATSVKLTEGFEQQVGVQVLEVAV